MQEGLNSPKKTLRPVKAMISLLLRTALWTSAILACGLYFTNEAVLPAMRKKAAAAKILPDAPLPEPDLKFAPAPGIKQPLPAADPLAMVRKYEQPATAGRAAAASRQAGTAIPQLKAGREEGWFAQVDFRPGEDRRIAVKEHVLRAGRRGENAEGAVLLPGSALEKKVALAGAKPVSSAAEKKYTGADKEAEKLREELKSRAEAGRERARRLRNEKLFLGGIILIISAILILLLSRTISAWRSIHKPEGSHWTLK